MAVMPVMPRESREWTVDDLDRIPDDGLQYELLDGMLLVSPAPVTKHQVAGAEVFSLLRAACSPDLYVLFSPLDWRPDPRTSLQPDVLVVPKTLLGGKNITEPLTLAVEVLSPSTRRKDLVLKRSKYEDAGVASYWVVDPELPSVVAFDLVDGHYLTVGEASGDEKLELKLPFPVTVVPSELLAPYVR
jgi:Uma2 family endonuclease